jgi:hypothetical protein
MEKLNLWLSPEETREIETHNAEAIRADYELSERLGREWAHASDTSWTELAA